MTAKTKSVQAGQTVQYFGSRPGPLAALVLMTPAEFDPEKAGYGMEAPADGELSLLIFGRNGRSHVRHNVPLEGSEAHAALVTKAAEHAAKLTEGLPEDVTAEELAESAAEAGEPWPAKPVTVRYWKPIA